MIRDAASAIDSVSGGHAFAASETELLVKQSYIGAWLMLVLIPAGISLDYFVYPDRLREFVAYRLAADVVVVASIYLHHRALARRWPRLTISLWLGVAIVMICMMISQTEGARSSYYVGLVLAVLAVGILLPLASRDVMILGAVTHLMYAVACLAPGAHFSAASFYNANYFLFLSVIISTTAAHFSERRRIADFGLRQQLQQRNEQLSELDAMKSRFFANVSHELRTPLTMILAPVQELLLRSELQSSVGPQLKTVEASARRLLRLVNDLLDLVRFEHTPVAIEQSQPIAFDGLLRALVEQMRYWAQKEGITLCYDIEQCPLVIIGNESDVERIFLNLLSNAVKFTDRGGRISVRARLEEGKVRIEVQDTGIGMSDADAARIFDRFQQVEHSDARRRQGIGLGLALVKELLARHGGTIEVETALGRGTTMIVRLPEATNVEGVVASHAGSTAPSRVLDGNGGVVETQDVSTNVEGAPEVLIVDDETEIRHFLARTLAREFRVLHAADGTEALRIIETARPTIVILDLMLPGLDGLEVCRRVKQDKNLRSIKILLLTARIDEGAKLEALANGADDFLTKPFSTVEVVTRIRNLHRTAQLENELRVQNSDLRETLRRLRKAEAELFQREKLSSLGTMAAGLLHEVNNPLNYTGMAIGVARKHPAVRADEGLAEIIADADEGVRRVQGIVSDLKTFATARPVEHTQAFKMQRTVEQAIRFCATELSRHDVIVHVGADLVSQGVEQQISQVLVNLLVNAARACHLAQDRKGRIEVRAEVQGARLQISVVDNGIGMAAEQKARIFDPFYTTSEVGKGMGLGLSVSHSIVERHGGSLTVESQVGVGSRFQFDVPLHVPEKPLQRSHVQAH